MVNTPLTFAEINEISKTLPTGIYLGTRIEYTLSKDSADSYFDAMGFKIVLSYPSICKIASAESAEEDLRCILYHEISHAMLTPKGLYQILGNDSYWESYSKTYPILRNDSSLQQDIKDGKFGSNVKSTGALVRMIVRDVLGTVDLGSIINIFEDQRIETLNKGIFLKVDFPAFVKKLNGYQKGEPIKSFLNFFYHVVRYNDIEPDLVKMLYEIIYNPNNRIIATARPSDISSLAGDFFDFLFACMQRWKKYCIANQQKQQQRQNQNQKNQPKQQSSMPSNNQADAEDDDEDDDEENVGNYSDNQGESSETSDKDNLDDSEDDSDSNQNENNQNEQAGNSASAPINDDSEDSNIDDNALEGILKDALKNSGYKQEDLEDAIEQIAEEVKTKCLKKVINQYNCTPAFTAKAEGYILRMLRRRSTEAKSLNGYSGRLNAKNVHRLGRVEDYRWFDKPNPNGLNATSGKFRINFFCDNSGSFRGNKDVANSIIRCLWQLSKKHPAFEFTLVTHGDKHVVRDDSHMELECNEGTELFLNLQTIFHDLQKKGQTVWNFVLFDGGVDNNYTYYKFWNHPNVIMICDDMDEHYINKFCPKAKRIFTNNYCDELEKNILMCMDQMFR